jgi:hypothetical protein
MGMRLAPAKPFYNSIKGKKKKSYKYYKLLLFLYFKFTFSIRLMATSSCSSMGGMFDMADADEASLKAENE